MLKRPAKISVIAILFLLFSVNAAKCISLTDLLGAPSSPVEVIGEALPFSNITVYKRWNEDEIPWDAWFRRGYGIILAAVISSFGIVILLFINNIRLKKLVKKNFQDVWEAEENYYRLLEIVNDAVIILDPCEQRIVGANKQAERLTGHLRIDLFDMNIFSITLSSDEKAVRALLEEIDRESFVNQAELIILNKEKKVIKTSLKGRLIKGYNKTIILLALSETIN